MKTTYFIALLFLCLQMKAQLNPEGQNILNDRGQILMQELTKKSKTIATNNNTNYNLETDYQTGFLYYKGKKSPKKYYLRYNPLMDLVETSEGGEVGYVLQSENISCKIINDEYIYSNLEKNNKGYLKLIYKGTKNSIYERKVTIYREGKKAKTSLTPDIPAKYITLISYYLKSTVSNIAKPIPSKRKKFIANFEKEDQKKIKSFLKEEKIDLKKNEDLIITYKFIETL